MAKQVHGTVKRSAYVSVLALGFVTSGALAADFSIKGNISETLTGSNNYFLSNSPSGATYQTSTGLGLNFLAQTPTTQYLFSGNGSYYKYFGPGAVDTNPTWGTPASTRFSIDHTTELDRYHLGASWSRVDTATTLLAQTGTLSGHGSTDTYNVNGAVTHDIGRIDSITLSSSASTASSSDASFTPYDDVTSALIWNHTLSPTTALINSVNFDWFSEKNTANSQRLFWTFMSGLNTQLTRRLTLKGDVGIAFVNSYQNGSAQPFVPVVPVGAVPFQPLVGAGHSLIWDVGLSYRLLKNTTASLNAAQSIIPLLTGQLQKSETVGLSVFHTINDYSSLSFSTNYAQTTSGQGVVAASVPQTSVAEFFSASVSYGYQLTRYWHSSLTYAYHQRNDSSGFANASVVTFTISRDLNILGNPSAINAAEQERARLRAQNTVGYVFPAFAPF